MRENNIFIYKFDKQKFKFRELFNKFALSNIGFNLEEIHKTDIGKLVPLEILSTGEDAMQPFCELFYNIDDEFNSCGKYIRNVHLKDRLKNGPSVRFGHGNANFKKLFFI